MIEFNANGIHILRNVVYYYKQFLNYIAIHGFNFTVVSNKKKCLWQPND